jgi:hypothetical protein
LKRRKNFRRTNELVLCYFLKQKKQPGKRAGENQEKLESFQQTTEGDRAAAKTKRPTVATSVEY